MALVEDGVDIVQALVDVITAAEAELEIANTYYGDVQLIPEFPSVTVEIFNKQRFLADEGSTHRFAVNFTVGITIYHEKVQESQLTKKETEQFAEAVEDKLHEDFYLGGLVVFGYVSSIRPGFIVKQRTMLRATRLTWEGISRQTF